MVIKRSYWLMIYITAVLLFFVMFYVDSKQKKLEIMQRQAAKIKLFSDIEQNKEILAKTVKNLQKPRLQIDNKLLDTAAVLGYLAYFFSAQNMTVHKIQLLKIKMLSGLSVLPVKVNVVGQFADFAKLLVDFAAGSRPVVVNDFSLLLDRNGMMVADLQLFVFGFYNKAMIMSHFMSHTANTESPMRFESLAKMQWVGFMRQGPLIWGLLMLPQGMTEAVRVGALIGKEKARVVQISENGMALELNGEKMSIVSQPLQS